MEKEKNLLMKYRGKLIKWGIIVVVLVAVVFMTFLGGYKKATEKHKETEAELKQQVSELKRQLEEEPVLWDDMPTEEITIKLIKSKIQDVGELVTTEYLYTDAGKFEDLKKIFGVSIPFTTKSFIAKWDGIIKAGVKVDDITIEINDEKKEILIYLPEAEISSHEIVSDSIETLDEKDGLFNSLDVKDVRKFDAANKESMEKRAIENGILDKANENAKEIIEKFVNNDAVQKQGYSITFKKSK